jgi:fucose 4-O-acetylase-like acetyltransferase
MKHHDVNYDEDAYQKQRYTEFLNSCLSCSSRGKSEIVNTEVKSKRIEYIDALKGFAIFCVLWGHSLQYLKGSYDSPHDLMFEFIYSFHMPLFFMVSGIFFKTSLKLNLKAFTFKKGVQLLLPCVVWAAIGILIRSSLDFINGNLHFSLALLKPIINPFGWIWFLRDLFASYLLVYVSLKFFKKQWLACLSSLIFVFIAPVPSSLNFLLPMFWAGIYLKDNYQIVMECSKQVLIVAGIVFAVCLLFWDGNYTMYVTPYRLLKYKPLFVDFDIFKIEVAVFRLLIGLFGSLFWFMLFKTIYSNNKFFHYINIIGTNTLSIYLLQRLILETWLNRTVNFPNMNIWIYDLFFTPLVALIVLVFCMIISKIVEKNKFTALLLFGKQ